MTISSCLFAGGSECFRNFFQPTATGSIDQNLQIKITRMVGELKKKHEDDLRKINNEHAKKVALLEKQLEECRLQITELKTSSKIGVRVKDEDHNDMGIETNREHLAVKTEKKPLEYNGQSRSEHERNRDQQTSFRAENSQSDTPHSERSSTKRITGLFPGSSMQRLRQTSLQIPDDIGSGDNALSANNIEAGTMDAQPDKEVEGHPNKMSFLSMELFLANSERDELKQLVKGQRNLIEELKRICELPNGMDNLRQSKFLSQIEFSDNDNLEDDAENGNILTFDFDVDIDHVEGLRGSISIPSMEDSWMEAFGENPLRSSADANTRSTKVVADCLYKNMKKRRSEVDHELNHVTHFIKDLRRGLGLAGASSERRLDRHLSF